MRVPRRVAIATTAAALSSPGPAALAIEQQVLFPVSWTGRWIVERKLESVEGDAVAAEAAWRAVGGNGEFVVGHIEEYENAFLPQEREQATIADMQTELATRSTAAVHWSGDSIRYKRRVDTGWTELRLLAVTSLRTLSNYGSLELWAVARESDRRGRGQLLVEVSRSFKPVNDQGVILAREAVCTYDQRRAKGEFEPPTSASRSSLTLRPSFRPLSDPMKTMVPFGSGGVPEYTSFEGPTSRTFVI